MLSFYETIVLPEAPDVTIFRDFTSKTTFYVMPKSPRFRVKDGLPVLKFLKYRSVVRNADNTSGAGFVFFDVSLDVPAQVQAIVKQSLQAVVNATFPAGNAPAVTISEIPWLEGSVSLTITSDEGKLVQKITSPGRPSLFGDNIATFAVELSEKGAPFFEQALQGKGGSVGVIYNLMTSSKLPPLEVKGSFHAEKFYQFFQTIDVDQNMWGEHQYKEKIREELHDSSSYTVTVEAGGASGATEEAILRDAKAMEKIWDWANRTMEDNIEKKLIEAITPVSEDGRKRPGSFAHTKRDIENKRIADYSLSLTESKTTIIKLNPQGLLPNITTLKGPDGQPILWKDYAQEVDLDDPFYQRLKVKVDVHADFTNLPIESVVVHLSYPGDREAVTATREYTAAKKDDTLFDPFFNRTTKSRKYTYQYEINYKNESRKFISGIKESDSDIETIGIDDLGLINVTIKVGEINFTDVEKVLVKMRYADPENGIGLVERQYTLTKDHTQDKFQVLTFTPTNKPYKYSLVYFMEDGREFKLKEASGTSVELAIDDPFSAKKRLTVMALGDMENEIADIYVDLAYVDPINEYRKSAVFSLNKALKSTTWEFPVIDESGGKTTYSGVITYKNNTVENIPLTETLASDTQILLGRKIEAWLEVEISPDLIDESDFAKIKLIKVTTRYEDPANEIDEKEDFILKPELEGSKLKIKPGFWKLGIKNKKVKQYKWKASYFLKDGLPIITIPETVSEDETLLLPEIN